jgi:hypothetical protein
MEAAPELLFCGDGPGAQILLAYWQDPSVVAAGRFGGAALQRVERTTDPRFDEIDERSPT